ncbi:hypothetical protein BS333_04950 [Vibrio azureus]|uniref:Flagellar sheath protein A n=1 Tax=Vibrio azureus NBRC 104587 TaxID=1219077 RepID=U3C037_9VIBR|nr:hypothetical protein [Vibrio azureus]AUI85772.1 hypothetical protein BS333_04950 [Vibrio azureus]GAD74879.1 hypothetical protein VAZ01S_016_00640 [Vibrio azureus NBRC 104587]
MKQLKIMPLVAVISGLMVGCGGGGGGGGGSVPAPKYTWQMINLYTANKTDVAPGCVIYGEQEGQDGKVITANVANSNFNIVFHNEDGSVIEKETIQNIADDGKVVIDTAKVPNNGYVSVEEIDGSIGGQSDIFMFSVQKDFLQNMTINIRQKQTNSACYKAEQYQNGFSDNALIAALETSTDVQYYQTSFIDSAVNGAVTPGAIPVKAPLKTSKNVLITAFDSYVSGKYTNLSQFVFANGSSIYDKTDDSSGEITASKLENVQNTDVNFKVNGVNLTSESAVTVGYKGELYLWQPIYTASQKLSYHPISSNGWALDLVGTTSQGNWLYRSAVAYNGSDVNLTPVNVTNFRGSVSTTCESSSSDFCLSVGGFLPADYDIQRIQVRANTANQSRLFYQTVFAKPSSSQVMMQSSLNEKLVANDSTRVEVTLGQLNINDKNSVKYFIENNKDINSLVTTTLPNFTDSNTSISTPSEVKARKLKLLSKNIVIMENSNNK